MKTRLLALAAALFMTIPLFAACTESGTTTENSTAAPVTTVPAEVTTPTYEFKNADYAQHEFNVLTFYSPDNYGWTGIPSEIDCEENGETLNDAVYTRNTKLESRLNISIISTVPDGNRITRALTADVEAKLYTYDVVDQSLGSISALYNAGLLSDMHDLDMDMSYVWWDQDSIETMTIADRLYAAASDITFMDKFSSVAVFYNDSLVKSMGLPNLYELVENEAWTFDKMLELGAPASIDLGASGFNSNDSYPISCQNDGSYYFLNAAGITTTKIGEDGNPTFNLDDNSVIDALQKIYSMMSDETKYYDRQKYALQPAAVAQMFAEDRALFLVRPVQSLYDLNATTAVDRFGIIPVPKFTETQDGYSTPINTWAATMFCLPRYVADYERTADILQGLAMYSNEIVMPALYETVLGVRLVGDQQASDMLDLIFRDRIYDLGMIWNFGGVRSTIVTSHVTYREYPNTIGSTLAGIKSQFLADITSMLNAGG